MQAAAGKGTRMVLRGQSCRGGGRTCDRALQLPTVTRALVPPGGASRAAAEPQQTGRLAWL